VVAARHGAVAVAQGLGARLRGEPGPGPVIAARQLRETLEQLGPTFVKLGQFLSSRSDLIPPEFQVELASLRDHVPPLPTSAVRAGLARSLAPRHPSEVFADFSLAPLACASIGQVHRATLADGRAVAVKVRRPAIDRKVESDLALLGTIVRALGRRSRSVRQLGLANVYEDFAAMLRAEFDYEAEAANAVSIGSVFAANPGVVVPGIVGELTAPGLLVMDLVDGVTLADPRALTAAGVDRPAMAAAVVGAYLTMILGHDRFHADPHPGNLFALPGGQLGIVDFGEVGTVSPSTRGVVSGLLAALAAGDAAGVATSALAICRQTRPVDADRLADDLHTLLAPLASGTLADVRLGWLIKGVMGILRRHGLQLPTDLGLLLKTVVECEATAKELDEGFELTGLLAMATRFRAGDPGTGAT